MGMIVRLIWLFFTDNFNEPAGFKIAFIVQRVDGVLAQLPNFDADTLTASLRSFGVEVIQHSLPASALQALPSCATLFRCGVFDGGVGLVLTFASLLLPFKDLLLHAFSGRNITQLGYFAGCHLATSKVSHVSCV